MENSAILTHMTLTDFFDRIYILNLPYRADRREAAIKELRDVSIHLEAGKVEVFPAIKPETIEPFHKLGSKGCFLSVLKMLKQSRAQGGGHVLIFQDDIQFPPFFKKEIGSLLKQLDEQPWDIAQFGYLSIESVDPAEVNVPFGTWKDMPNIAIGAHFFAVNGQSLDRYIQFLEGLLTRPRDHAQGGPMPIDGTFAVFRQLNPDVVRLIAMPSFGDQRSSRSDITPRWFDKIPLVSTLAELCR
ncbi:MAG: LPS biosynthesis glycosyltransferase [Cyanobacteria bacterium J06581_3]